MQNRSSDTPDEIKTIASNAKGYFLTSKYMHLYEETYQACKNWCSKKKIKITTEDSILAYFDTDLARYKSSSLWTKYSMLRAIISLREGVDISKFTSIIPLLKRKNKGYKVRKSPAFCRKTDQFLVQASNEDHLLNKVVVIFGVAGACRRQELVSLTTNCVKDYQTHFLVNLVETKTKEDRTFMIVPGNLKNVNLLEVVRTYIARQLDYRIINK